MTVGRVFRPNVRVGQKVEYDVRAFYVAVTLNVFCQPVAGALHLSPVGRDILLHLDDVAKSMPEVQWVHG